MPARNPFHKRMRNAFKRRTDGPGLEPIPGSITYSGQPRTKLTKLPGGSALKPAGSQRASPSFKRQWRMRMQSRALATANDRALKSWWRLNIAKQ
ncbi:hypothetical protein ELI54_01080 [Rhizobium ruizarguesonis]|nr:hypothetical protein [Rhizobium ruizarguesonis]TAT86911.1 hypothetical protein ELI54_01080 [Rhizobium ruizarguesonis]TBB90768.1 hypothetical protein ELH38_01070 [Rhizobium ruizarguesonis]